MYIGIPKENSTPIQGTSLQGTRRLTIIIELNYYRCMKQPIGRPKFTADQRLASAAVKRAASERLRASRARMVHLDLSLHPEQLEAFKETVYAVSVDREAQLKPRHTRALGRPKPLAVNLTRYSFLIFKEDEDYLRAVHAAMELSYIPQPLWAYYPSGTDVVMDGAPGRVVTINGEKCWIAD